ncbi:MAG TPA: hypothetical protein VK956_12480, partial [Verrucomicrobium sp.]|nr:hypothetical protein [Verrucomicrobium sp.]
KVAASGPAVAPSPPVPLAAATAPSPAATAPPATSAGGSADRTNGSPSKFRYDYSGPDPGSRYWTRQGLRWKETHPSGKQSEFEITGFISLNGITGTEIKRIGTVPLTIFVPDLGTPVPFKLFMQGSNGQWGFIGYMSEVE